LGLSDFKSYRSKTTPGSKSMPTWMDDVDCSGGEGKLADCSFKGWGRENCGHSEDVILTCAAAEAAGSVPVTEAEPEAVPAVAGPAVAVPAVAGPAVAGPAVAGPALAGPALPAPAGVGVTEPVLELNQSINQSTPTAVPTPAPTAAPTPIPTAAPTPIPTAAPTPIPSAAPTPIPSAAPTQSPSAASSPLGAQAAKPMKEVTETIEFSGSTEIWSEFQQTYEVAFAIAIGAYNETAGEYYPGNSVRAELVTEGTLMQDLPDAVLLEEDSTVKVAFTAVTNGAVETVTGDQFKSAVKSAGKVTKAQAPVPTSVKADAATVSKTKKDDSAAPGKPVWAVLFSIAFAGFAMLK